MTITAMITKFKALNIETVSSEAVEQTKDAIADLNVEQMNRGLRADGSPISPSYSNLTRQLKAAKGLNPNIVSLRDTGAFQAAMFTDVQGLRIITGSNDPKAAKLEKKYSKARGSIFGLSEKFKAEYIRENLRPAFNKRITDLIGLKF